MKYKGVLFDFDGTLVASMEVHFAGWKYAMKQFGKNIEPQDLYVLEGQGLNNVGTQLLQKAALSVDNLPQVLALKREYFKNQDSVELYPGVKQLLQFLAEKGIKIGVVTGGDRERVIESLNYYGVEKYFATTITSDDVQHTKPHPEPFVKAVQNLQLLPEECIVIENAPLGVQAAKSAGCYCIAIQTTLTEEFLSEADHTVMNYDGLFSFFSGLY